MKSQFKLNRIGSCMFFVVAVLIALSFSGCHTPAPTPVTGLTPVIVPLTDAIVTEFGGFDEMTKFQFYISKNVSLRIDGPLGNSIIQEGIGIRSGYIVHETVSLKAIEPGLLLFPARSPEYLFNVAFEHHEGSPVIHFAKQGNGPNDRYEIVYDDPANRSINYGGKYYIVEFAGDEQPYLMIKILEYIIQSDSRRDTPGLTFD